jgi:hypothetical protein
VLIRQTRWFSARAVEFEEVQKLPLATRYIRSLYSVFSGGFA